MARPLLTAPVNLTVSTQLPCGHTVDVASPGDFAGTCPHGCDLDRPQHRRR